jgi:hypothetical protein
MPLCAATDPLPTIIERGHGTVQLKRVY